MNTPEDRFKSQVARSFSRAAGSYDQVAHLQRYIARKLRENCPFDVSNSSPVLLDAGCGTGHEWPALCEKICPERIVGLDLAEGMAQYAVSHARKLTPIVNAVVGDIEHMPFPDESLDCIHTSLAVQWCQDFKRMLEECFRCLRPGGVIMISTLLQGTLAELEAAWKHVDGWQHVNHFLTLDEVDRAMVSSAWDDDEHQMTMQTEQVILEYQSVRELTSELKALGAHNLTPGRKRSVMSRTAVRGFVSAYERFRMAHDKLPATYEVLYCYLKKSGNSGGIS